MISIWEAILYEYVNHITYTYINFFSPHIYLSENINVVVLQMDFVKCEIQIIKTKCNQIPFLWQHMHRRECLYFVLKKWLNISLILFICCGIWVVFCFVAWICLNVIENQFLFLLCICLGCLLHLFLQILSKLYL